MRQQRATLGTITYSAAMSACEKGLAAAVTFAQARVAPAKYFLSMLFERLTLSIQTK